MKQACFFTCRRKPQCQKKREMRTLLCGSLTLAMKVFPCKEKSLGSSQYVAGEGAVGRWGL